MEIVSKESVGFDLGCGTGRWAKSVAPKVKKLICIDPSSAIDIAKRNLSAFNNCEFEKATVDEMSILDNSMDFGYSLGVLHHIPNTELVSNNLSRSLKMARHFCFICTIVLIIVLYGLDLYGI